MGPAYVTAGASAGHQPVVGDIDNDGDPDAAQGAGSSFNLIINYGAAANTPPTACTSDIDGDGDTDVFDFALFAASFGTTVAPGTSGDFDDDGDVDVFDFAFFAGDFGCMP